MKRIFKAVKDYICVEEIIILKIIDNKSIIIMYFIDIWSINKSPVKSFSAV